MIYVLDVAVLLLFGVVVYVGYKRGFIKTATGVVTLLAAMIVASTFAEPLSAWIYDTALEPSIRSSVEEQITAAGSNILAQVDAAYESLPTVVQAMLAQVGVPDSATLNQQLASDASVNPAYRVMDVVRTAVLPVLEVSVSVVLFLAASVLVGWLLKVLDLAARLPVLQGLNKGLGLVCGVVSGILWVLFAITVLQLLIAFGVLEGFVDMITVNDTIVVKWLVYINPFATTVMEYMK